MKTNEFMELNKKKFRKSGALSLHDVSDNEKVILNCVIKNAFTFNGKRYTMHYTSKASNLYDYDVAILYPQIAANLGLESVPAFVVEANGIRFLAREDVLANNKNLVLADTLNNFMVNKEKEKKEETEHILYKKGFNTVLANHFTPNAIKDKIKMDIIDLVILNGRRTPDTFCYDLTGSNMVKKVIPLDAGESSYNLKLLKNQNLDYDTKYLCETRINKETDKKVLKDIITNKRLNRYFTEKDRAEFGKELKELSLFEVKENIKHTTNYEIDDGIIDVYSNRAYFIGRALERGV